MYRISVPEIVGERMVPVFAIVLANIWAGIDAQRGKYANPGA
jgi:hypothetical protein